MCKVLQAMCRGQDDEEEEEEKEEEEEEETSCDLSSLLALGLWLGLPSQRCSTTRSPLWEKCWAEPQSESSSTSRPSSKVSSSSREGCPGPPSTPLSPQ